MPGTFRPQGLPTLATVCSLDCLARLVSCGQRPWGSPFGAFSSLKVVVHSCTTRPACRHCGLSPRRTEARRGDKTEDRLPGASSSESLAARRVFSPPAAGSSHGFFPSQGYQSPAWAGISARLLPRRWLIQPVTRLHRLDLGVSIRVRLIRPRRPDTPLRVLHLHIPGIGPIDAPGLWVHLADDRPFLTDSIPLLGSASACRSCQGCGWVHVESQIGRAHV